MAGLTLKSVKCLVVEDEPTILRLVTLVLEDMGCETLAAADAEGALNILSEQVPDVLIADVRLPGMNGVDLANRVRSSDRHSSTAVLLMSAYGEPSHHGCDGFLAKPFDIESLTEFVEPFLADSAGPAAAGKKS